MQCTSIDTNTLSYVTKKVKQKTAFRVPCQQNGKPPQKNGQIADSYLLFWGKKRIIPCKGGGFMKRKIVAVSLQGAHVTADESFINMLQYRQDKRINKKQGVKKWQ